MELGYIPGVRNLFRRGENRSSPVLIGTSSVPKKIIPYICELRGISSGSGAGEVCQLYASFTARLEDMRERPKILAPLYTKISY